LFITLLESGFVGGLGFSVAQQNQSIRTDAYWFGEAQSRVVVSVSPSAKKSFEDAVSASGISLELLGEVKGHDVQVNKENWGKLSEWKNNYDEKISSLMS
jgi:phosphoribosylformylglycinamidine synthase